MPGKIAENYLLEVKQLNKVFEIRDAALRKRNIKAVDGVSFKIKGMPGKLKTTVNPIKTLTPRFITKALEKRKK